MVVKEKWGTGFGRHGSTLIYVALRTSGRHLNWVSRCCDGSIDNPFHI